MKSDTQTVAESGLECLKKRTAIVKLKTRLQENFERVHPGRGRLIEQAVSEAEELAWETSFPQLFLPDFAELRLAEIVAAQELHAEAA